MTATAVESLTLSVAQWLIAEGWSEVSPQELAQDIEADPGLYYPEYRAYCQETGIPPMRRGEWRLTVSEHG